MTMRAVLYAKVSSKEQEQEGFSIPAQLKLLKEYSARQGMEIVREFVDVETAKQAGRTAFGEMVGFLKESPSVRILLVEKTDRLYRNFRDYVIVSKRTTWWFLRVVLWSSCSSLHRIFLGLCS